MTKKIYLETLKKCAGSLCLPLLPYLIPFLSVLHQSKVLHNFHKRGQFLIAGRMKGLH